MTSRRTILAAFAPAILRGAPPPPIRIAFLGGGHAHGLGKAQVVLNNPSFQIAGIYEPDPAVLARFTRLGIASKSKAEILGDSSIRVVAVESDVLELPKLAIEALQSGKHTHVDKPPSYDMAGIRKMVELARANKLILQQGYMWRYHPGMNAMIKAVKDGLIGDVFLVRGIINTYIEAAKRPELARFAGGEMFELGSHLIDATVRLMGAPGKVDSILRKDGSFADSLKDNTLAVLHYPKAMAMIQSATLQRGASAHRTFEVQGSKGTLTLQPIEPGVLRMDIDGKVTTTKYDTYKRYVDDFINLAEAVEGRAKMPVSLETELVVEETLLRASSMV